MYACLCVGAECLCVYKGLHSLMCKLRGSRFLPSYHLQTTMCSVFQGTVEASPAGVYDLHTDSMPLTNRGSSP